MEKLPYHYDARENQTWVGKYRYAGLLKLKYANQLFPDGVVVQEANVAVKDGANSGFTS